MRFLTDLKTVPPMARILGFLGLVPFLAGGFGVWLPNIGALAFALPLLVMIYAAIIASFLGGVRWGTAMQNGQTAEQARYLVFSIIPSLMAFVAINLPIAGAMLLLMIVFLAQCITDLLAVKAGHIAAWFAPLRLVLTFGVCLSLMSLLVHAR